MSDTQRKIESVLWRATQFAMLLLLTPTSVLSADKIQVTFQLANATLTAFEPVYLTLSIRNGLNETISFGPAPFEDSLFNLTVTQPDGSVVRPARVVHGGIQFEDGERIVPGSTCTRRLFLSDRYEFKQPGEYKLSVWLGGPIHTASGRSLTQDVRPGLKEHHFFRCDEQRRHRRGRGENSIEVSISGDFWTAMPVRD